MTILTHKLPSFVGVKAGQTATCRIPSGYAYHTFYLSLLKANAASGDTGFRPIDIQELRLVANGITIQRWKGNDLDWINQFDGMPSSGWGGDPKTHYLALTCVRNALKTRAAQEATALAFGAVNDPRPITTLLIECDIDSTAPSDIDIVVTPPYPVGPTYRVSLPPSSSSENSTTSRQLPEISKSPTFQGRALFRG